MKKHVDTKRKDVTFTIGQWVYVKLRPFRQCSVAGLTHPKLSKRFFGPFQITDRISAPSTKHGAHPSSISLFPLACTSQVITLYIRNLATANRRTKARTTTLLLLGLEVRRLYITSNPFGPYPMGQPPEDTT